MKRDLNLEGFSVLGSITDCVALRKLVYKPKNRRPDKILENPLIYQLESALVCFNQDKIQTTDF